MSLEIRINSSFSGPTLLELEPVLPEIKGPIEVKWQGTKAEVVALQRHLDREFVLNVPDLPAMERTATLLGQPLTFATGLLATALTSLTSRKAYNWRAFVNENFGSMISRSIVVKLAAGAIRKGKIPKLADVAADCVLENVNPVDADVLLRLRVLRGANVD